MQTPVFIYYITINDGTPSITNIAELLVSLSAIVDYTSSVSFADTFPSKGKA